MKRKMPVTLLAASILLIAMISLTACAGEKTSSAPVVVLPELQAYGPEFQVRLADELGDLRPFDCPRTGRPHPDCSALAVYAADHQHLRDQIRAAQGD